MADDPCVTAATEHDCGHTCCDERHDPMHDHFLAPDNCPSCTAACEACGHSLAGHGEGLVRTCLRDDCGCVTLIGNKEGDVTHYTIEAVSVRDGDVICDKDGNVWRFDDREDYRWTDFDGNGLRHEVPPGPYTLLVRDGRPVVDDDRAQAVAAVMKGLADAGFRLVRDV